MDSYSITGEIKTIQRSTSNGTLESVSVSLLKNNQYVDLTDHEFYKAIQTQINDVYVNMVINLIPVEYKILIKLSKVTDNHKKLFTKLLKKNWWMKNVVLHYHHWNLKHNVTDEEMYICYECDISDLTKALESDWFSVGSESHCQILVVEPESIRKIFKSFLSVNQRTVLSILQKNSIIIFDNYENGINFGVSSLHDCGKIIIKKLISDWQKVIKSLGVNIE